jgi:hypothetical protein
MCFCSSFQGVSIQSGYTNTLMLVDAKNRFLEVGRNIYYPNIFGHILNRINQTFIRFGKIFKKILFNRDSVSWFLKIDQIKNLFLRFNSSLKMDFYFSES